MLGIIGGFCFLLIDEGLQLFVDLPFLTPVWIGYLLFALGGWKLKRDERALDPGVRYALLSAACALFYLIAHMCYGHDTIIPVMIKAVALPILSTLMLYHVGKGLIDLEKNYGCDWHGRWIWIISIYANLSFAGLSIAVLPLFIFVIADCIIAWISMGICIGLIIRFWLKLNHTKKLSIVL